MIQIHKPSVGWLLAGIAILAVGGCGGDGASQFGGASPFAGSYTGTWLFGPTGANGAASIVITPDHHLTGTLEDDSNVTITENAIATTIKNSGDCLGTFTPDGGSPITIAGTLIVGSDGHLAGTLDETAGGNQIGQISIDLVKSP